MEDAGDRAGEPGLLGAGDPPPVELRNAAGGSPFVLVCEHAGREVPAALADRSPPPDDMGSPHRMGSGRRGRGTVAGGPAGMPSLVAQQYSRLVIDCNRPAGVPTLVPGVSDGSTIPFNQALRPADIEARWREIHAPFQRAVVAALDSRDRPILVDIHSFTRRLRGGPLRHVEFGLLSRREPSLAPPLRKVMRDLAPGLEVRFNEPYCVKDESDYTIPVHAEARSLLHVLLEIRNDLISDEESVETMGSLAGRGLAGGCGRIERGRRDVNLLELDTRDVPIRPEMAALLIVDVQNFCVRREGGEFRGLSDAEFEARYGPFQRHVTGEVLPNIARIATLCRAAGIEVMYTVIESLTLDGRDRSLDYRITGFHVPRGSWDAQVCSEVAPVGDEIVLPKTSSNVFVSTNIDYVLRNMEKRQLIVAGLVTDQCVSSAVRDACDLGYLVTLTADACATYSEARHSEALSSLSGYCRQRTTATLAAELEGLQHN